jgi:hypothetical protein
MWRSTIGPGSRRAALYRLLLIPLLGGHWMHSGSGLPEHEQRGFENITHAAGIHERHHIRQFSNPYAEIMQGYTRVPQSRLQTTTETALKTFLLPILVPLARITCIETTVT